MKKIKPISNSVSDDIEINLDRADYEAEHTKERLTAEEVFSGLRKTINEGRVDLQNHHK